VVWDGFGSGWADLMFEDLHGGECGLGEVDRVYCEGWPEEYPQGTLVIDRADGTDHPIRVGPGSWVVDPDDTNWH
jgi:hypothetical protein